MKRKREISLDWKTSKLNLIHMPRPRRATVSHVITKRWSLQLKSGHYKISLLQTHREIGILVEAFFFGWNEALLCAAFFGNSTPTASGLAPISVKSLKCLGACWNECRSRLPSTLEKKRLTKNICDRRTINYWAIIEGFACLEKEGQVDEELTTKNWLRTSSCPSQHEKKQSLEDF